MSGRRCIVVMGVSGSGKTTVAQALAGRLRLAFCDADDLHPGSNVAKMRAGVALTDEDRRPWLQSVATWIAEQETSSVVACSALRRSYRDVIRSGSTGTLFCCLDVPETVLADRLAQRAEHWMPPSLLASQLDTLEPLQSDEPGFTVSGEGTPDDVLSRIADVTSPLF